MHFLFFIFFVFRCNAQEDTTINGMKFSWYDNYVSPVTDSIIHIYMEKSGIETETGRIIGFYENTNKIYCLGEMAEDMYQGHWISWHTNGQIETEGEFHRKGIRKGKWKWYHANGQLKAETFFHIHLNLFSFRYTANPEYYHEFYEQGDFKIKYQFKDRDYFSQQKYYENGSLCYYANANQDTIEYYCPDGVLVESIYSNENYFNENISGEINCYPELPEPFIDIFSESWPKHIKVKF